MKTRSNKRHKLTKHKTKKQFLYILFMMIVLNYVEQKRILLEED